MKKSKQGSQHTAVNSHTNYRFLNSPEKNVRLKILHNQNRLINQKLTRLRTAIERLTEARGIDVDNDLDTELRGTVSQKSSAVQDSYTKDSFGYLFWENQKRAMSYKDSCAMRWDPLMIRWCLYLRHVCGSGYDILRESGVIKLPSQRTLRDYTYFTKAKAGFSDDVDQQLMTAAKIKEASEREKHVLITMDEMHIKEDLVYDKHTGL